MDSSSGIDVLLFPSQWPESYGLTVREALTRGVWPVGSNLGAVAEAVEDGVNGSLITVDGTHRPLADALAWILDHRDIVRAPRPVPPIPTFDEQSNDLIRHFIDVVLSGGRTPLNAGDEQRGSPISPPARPRPTRLMRTAMRPGRLPSRHERHWWRRGQARR